jgi:hypothetical protein
MDTAIRTTNVGTPKLLVLCVGMCQIEQSAIMYVRVHRKVAGFYSKDFILEIFFIGYVNMFGFLNCFCLLA